MSGLTQEDFARRAREIRWLLLDCDGVLTDGGIYYDRRGHGLLRFNVQDGLGVRLAQRSGLRCAILSGRASRALALRAKELDIEELIMGSKDKATDFDRFLERVGAEPRQVACAGDDLGDLRILGRCGLSFAPVNAAAQVRAVAHRVLSRPGGRGAVRELVEALLEARGEWPEILSSFSLEAP